MPRVGAFVKPSRPPLTWRLGVVEEELGDGRLRVRLHVAPVGSYAGTAIVCGRDEIDEVPRARVEGYLQVVRAEIAQRVIVARQLEDALAAASRLGV